MSKSKKAMDVNTATNGPFPIVLGGREFRAKMIPLGQLFARFERRVKDDARLEAEEWAQVLPTAERKAFVLDAFRDRPRGASLAQMTQQLMASPQGLADIVHLAVAPYQPEVKVDDIAALITGATLDDLGSIVEQLTGIAVDDDDEDEDEADKPEEQAGADGGPEGNAVQAAAQEPA